MTKGEEIAQGLIDAGWLDAAWQHEVAARIDAALEERYNDGRRNAFVWAGALIDQAKVAVPKKGAS